MQDLELGRKLAELKQEESCECTLFGWYEPHRGRSESGEVGRS